VVKKSLYGYPSVPSVPELENPSGGSEVAVQRAVLQGMNDIKPLQEGVTGKSPGFFWQFVIGKSWSKLIENEAWELGKDSNCWHV
jgi:hypothetical protein